MQLYCCLICLLERKQTVTKVETTTPCPLQDRALWLRQAKMKSDDAVKMSQRGASAKWTSNCVKPSANNWWTCMLFTADSGNRTSMFTHHLHFGSKILYASWVELSWFDLTWVEPILFRLEFQCETVTEPLYGSYTRGMVTCFAIRLNSAGYVELWLCLSGCMSNSLQNCTGISMYIHIFLCRMWDMEVSWEGFCKVVLGMLMFGCSSFPCPSRTVALTRTGIVCV